MKVGRSAPLVEPGTVFHFTYALLPINEMPIKTEKRFVVKHTRAECESAEMTVTEESSFWKQYTLWDVFFNTLTYKKIIKKTQYVNKNI